MNYSNDAYNEEGQETEDEFFEQRVSAEEEEDTDLLGLNDRIYESEQRDAPIEDPVKLDEGVGDDAFEYEEDNNEYYYDEYSDNLDSEDEFDGEDSIEAEHVVTTDLAPDLIVAFANDIARRDGRAASSVALTLLMIISAILDRRLGVYPRQRDLSAKISAGFSVLIVSDDRREHPARIEQVLRHIDLNFSWSDKRLLDDLLMKTDHRREIVKGKLKLIRKNAAGTVESIFTPPLTPRQDELIDSNQVLFATVRNSGLKCLEGQHKDLSLTTRFLMTRPPKAAWTLSDEPVAEDLMRAVANLLRGVNEIRKSFADLDNKEIFLHLNDDAQRMYDQFLLKLEAQMRADDEDEAMLAYLDTTRDSLLRLALVLYVAERVSTGKKITSNHKINALAMRRALAWIAVLTEEATDIFALILSDNQTQELVMKKVLDNRVPKEFSARDMYHPRWGGLESSKAVKKALISLVQRQRLSMRVVPPRKRGGGSRILYFLPAEENPATRDSFEEFDENGQEVEEPDESADGEIGKYESSDS